jgi:hypothetical protein
MTTNISRAFAATAVVVCAFALSANAQTTVNPSNKQNPPNEHSGQSDQATAKDSAAPNQQHNAKPNERDANAPSGVQGSNQQNPAQQNAGQKNSSQQNLNNGPGANKQANPNPQRSGSNMQPGNQPGSAGRQNTGQQGAQNQGNQPMQSGNRPAQSNQPGQPNMQNQTFRNQQQGDRDQTNSFARRNEGPRERTALRPTDMRGPDLGLWFNRSTRDGLVITDVATRGPIARFGFRESDRIVSVNGQRIVGEADFINDLFAANVDRVPVIVLRDGREETIFVEPGLLTENYVQVDPLEQFGVVLDDRYNDRIVVWRVIPRSPAYYAGVREGDVISTLSGRPYSTRTEFETGVRDLRSGEANLQVRRGDRNRDLTVDVPEFDRSGQQAGAQGSEQGMRNNNADRGNQRDENVRTAERSGDRDRGNTDRDNNDRNVSNNRQSNPGAPNVNGPSTGQPR